MSIPYGYYLAPNGYVIIDQEKANIVRMIYQQYLSGMSPGRIADFLSGQDTLSPISQRQGCWTYPVRNELLSNTEISWITSYQRRVHFALFLTQLELLIRMEKYLNIRLSIC